jgi:ssDNA-binding Zn-finger/Zn-ribbon topoisomerase 1
MILQENPPEEIRRLRDLDYRDYIKSIWWRKRRHARLQTTGGRCERCGKAVLLVDVHHMNYDRLGEERDTDLEVLCRDCHRIVHNEQSRQQSINAYLHLAKEVARIANTETAVDLRELLRDRCREFGLPIDHRVDDAINVVMQHQVSLVTHERRREVASTPDLPPISKEEAIRLCRRLGVSSPFHPMPQQYGYNTGIAAQLAARIDAARCPKCNRRDSLISRTSPGWAFCSGCGHRWDLGALKPS